MYNNNNNGNGNQTTGADVETKIEFRKDDIFGDREVEVVVEKTTETQDSKKDVIVKDKADVKTVSSIQRAKDKLADLQKKMKDEIEAIKKLEKQEALKADKELAVLVRNFHSTGFSDFNAFKASINKILN